MQKAHLLFPIFLLAVVTLDKAHCSDTAKAAPTSGEDSDESLIRIARSHLALAQKKDDAARLVELFVSNVNPEALKAGRPCALNITSSFASPDDDVWYIKVQEIRSLNSNDRARPPWVEKAGFIRKICDQGYVRPEMNCGQYTGEPEPHKKHLPIRNWSVDLSGILRSLETEQFRYPQAISITVTTAGRIRTETHRSQTRDAQTPKDTGPLESLSDGEPLISLGWTEPGREQKIHYIILKADTGDVIATQEYKQPANRAKP